LTLGKELMWFHEMESFAASVSVGFYLAFSSDLCVTPFETN
jgi:hypothetical protein